MNWLESRVLLQLSLLFFSCLALRLTLINYRLSDIQCVVGQNRIEILIMLAFTQGCRLPDSIWLPCMTPKTDRVKKLSHLSVHCQSRPIHVHTLRAYGGD